MERLLTYDRYISFHRNKLDVQTYPSDKLNMAYLDEKFNQFKIHLESSPDNLIIKTLKEINIQLQEGDEIFKYSICNTSILTLIFNHLKSNHNDEIRINSALCFKQFCRLKSSQAKLHELEYTKKLKSVFDDKNALVRINVVEGLIYYASFRESQEFLLNDEVLELVIEKINNEKNESVLNQFLILSNEILSVDKASKLALGNNFVQILKKSMNYNKTKIRISVYINYGSLSLDEEGKEACTNEGELIIDSLNQVNEQISLLEQKNKPSNYLELDSLNMLIALTRFQNSVSILKRGKVEIFENKGLDSYLKLLKLVTTEQIIINILQVIGNTAEEPRARKFMLSRLSDIEVFLKSSNEFIQRQAKMTLDIISWKP